MQIFIQKGTPRAPAEVPLESDIFHRDSEDPWLNCFMQHRCQVTKIFGGKLQLKPPRILANMIGYRLTQSKMIRDSLKGVENMDEE